MLYLHPLQLVPPLLESTMVSSKASFYFVQVKKNTLLVGILLYGQPLSVYGGIFLLILGGGPTKKNLILTKGYSVNI